jgi:branched-subunit amino acid transport protein AzlD
MNENILEIIKYTIPALAAIGTTYLIHYLQNEKLANETANKMKLNMQDKVLPLRLTAYERCVLFLERIQPYSIFPRLNPHNRTVGSLHEMLLKEINEEFEYNVVQQLYVSPIAWKMLVNTKNSYIKMIDELAAKYMPQEPGLELANAILLAMKEEETAPPFKTTIEFFKKELTTVFF